MRKWTGLWPWRSKPWEDSSNALWVRKNHWRTWVAGHGRSTTQQECHPTERGGRIVLKGWASFLCSPGGPSKVFSCTLLRTQPQGKLHLSRSGIPTPGLPHSPESRPSVSSLFTSQGSFPWPSTDTTSGLETQHPVCGKRQGVYSSSWHPGEPVPGLWEKVLLQEAERKARSTWQQGQGFQHNEDTKCSSTRGKHLP